jgi:hypothetical protein
LFMYSKILSIVSHFATVVVIGSLLFVSSKCGFHLYYVL